MAIHNWGTEMIYGVYDERNRNIGHFKHDTIRPILFTIDDHLRYIWYRYNSAATLPE